MVANYRAKTVIAYKEDAGQAIATDRYILDLDYDLKTSKVVGSIKIQRFKSSSSGFQNVERSRPAPSAQGEYEHFEVTAAKDKHFSQLDLTGSRARHSGLDLDLHGDAHQEVIPRG